jgi:hypothetical protein
MILYGSNDTNLTHICEKARRKVQFILEDIESDEMPQLTKDDATALTYFHYPESNAHA